MDGGRRHQQGCGQTEPAAGHLFEPQSGQNGLHGQFLSCSSRTYGKSERYRSRHPVGVAVAPSPRRVITVVDWIARLRQAGH